MKLTHFTIKYNKLSNQKEKDNYLLKHLYLFGIQENEFEFGKKFIEYYQKDIRILKIFKECGFDNFDFNRYENYLKHLKEGKSCSNYDFFKLKYGNILGEVKRNEKINNTVNNYSKEDLKKVYPLLSDIEIDEKIKRTKEKTAGSLNSFIERYGENVGKKKYKEFCEKSGYRNTKEGKVELFGEKKGVEKYKLQNKKNAFSSTLKGHIKRYGKEKGKELYKIENELRSKNGSTEELLKKFGPEKTKQIIERRSLVGSKDGLYSLGYNNIEINDIFEKRIIYFKNPIKYFINKGYSQKKAKIKAYKNYTGYHNISNKEIEYLINKNEFYKSSKNERYQASKESLKILLPLKNWLLDNSNFKSEDIKIGYGNTKEYFIKYGNNKKVFFDFTIEKIKLIIEYDSLFWHPDKKIPDNDLINWRSKHGKSGIEIRIKDKEKTKIAKKNGFKVIRINNYSKKQYILLINLLKNENKKYNFLKR